MKFTPRADGYDWKFLTVVAGETLRDTGSGRVSIADVEIAIRPLVRALARERSSGVAWRQQRSMPMHIDSPAADTLITAKKLRIRDLETRPSPHATCVTPAVTFETSAEGPLRLEQRRS